MEIQTSKAVAFCVSMWYVGPCPFIYNRCALECLIPNEDIMLWGCKGRGARRGDIARERLPILKLNYIRI